MTAKKDFNKKMGTLRPKKHKQIDLFIADNIEIINLRDDMASMEHPFFALKAGDLRTRIYTNGNTTVEVSANIKYGMATIFDKDIWIYATSKLQQAIFLNEPVSQKIQFTIYDFLTSTNRDVGGKNYENFVKALNRLKGTTIFTNIETEEETQASGFGLIDSWKAIDFKKGAIDITEVEITLPLWLFEQITKNNVLKISPDYFRIRKAIDRRIYEIARKHCGAQKEFKIGINLLWEKSGTTSVLKKFRLNIKELAKRNDLPDYNIVFDIQNDMVIFNQKSLLIKDNKNIQHNLESKVIREQKELNKTIIVEGDSSNFEKIKDFIDTQYHDKNKYQLLNLLSDEEINRLLIVLNNDADKIINGIREFIDFDFSSIQNPIGYFFTCINKEENDD